MRKPFSFLAEELSLATGRGKWTPIELFAEGVGTMAQRVRSLILSA